MKNKLILIAIAFITPLLILNFYFPFSDQSNISPPAPQLYNFILGAMDNSKDINYTNISNPDVFGMNTWHRYSGHDTINGRSYPHGWTPNDSLFADNSRYPQEIKDKLKDISDHNMKALMVRPKIEWLAYGQRSDYQCETVPMSDNFWFYSFKSNQSGHVHTGENWPDTSYGNNTMVKRCLTGTGGEDHPPGYVVDRLKANNEQAKTFNAGGFNPGNDNRWKWYVKPRIRIDSMFARTNPETPVCSLKIIKSDGTLLREVIIKARYFLKLINNVLQYDGSYIEEYSFPIDNELEIDGAWGPNRGGWTARGDIDSDPSLSDTGFCHADIQVYWYGNCNMWIDYVRVDNDVADGLLNSY